MKKLLLSLTLISASFVSHSIFAQDVSQMKEMSMKACESQAAQMPEAQKEMILNMCKCTVENTDYEALIAKSAAGDTSVQADALAVAQKCAQQAS